MRIWDYWSAVAERVRQRHVSAGMEGGAHDFTHAKRVAEMARQAAEEEWGDARLAQLCGLAGLVHNADRILQAEMHLGRSAHVPSDAVSAMVLGWIDSVVTVEEFALIMDAVLKHNLKNGPDDSRVLIALQTGDKVVNTDPDVLIRCGQHHPDLPAVDWDYFPATRPGTSYKDPRSVIRNLQFALEWGNPTSGFNVRTALGIREIGKNISLMQMVFDQLQERLVRQGILS